MRLEKIKLAGFKSFVDPTTVLLPSNLVGVIGPNGCGKSNVIDAVRWVMGESSAKMLRGESMSDVIFNGSNTRKPVGTASIELVFDNSDGSAGGQYAQYAQISVKRQVSRDGQSAYFLNGTRCRRRDITDLFLGTGLGPRSYSIIEQGTISRVVEARPEELRAFLEEAAGISKYKERRRETENRMRHTRENLDRIKDLKEEIEKQLQHLKRQAATAERYKEYKEQERRLKAELLALRWRQLDQDLASRESAISQKETELEQAIARQRSVEASLERDRERHQEQNEQFNQVQGEFYRIGSEIAQMEQAIQFARESRNQLEQDLRQAEQAWQESTEHQQSDQQRLEELERLLEQEQPQLEQAREIEQQTSLRLAECEQAMQVWQSSWESFNREAAEPAQTAQVERTRINHLEQQEQSLQRRIERAGEELRLLEDPRLDAEIEQLQQQQEQSAALLEQLEQQYQEWLSRIRESRDQGTELGRQLDQGREALQRARGRYASLEALQQAALGEQGGLLRQWLEQQGLSSARRLAQCLEVDPAWQNALERVLGFHLQAMCVEDLDALGPGLSPPENGAVSLVEPQGQGHSAPPGSLAATVRDPGPLAGLLDGVLLADNLEQALERRSTLAPGESLITPEGIWVGRHWLRMGQEDDATRGVLEREQEMRRLQQSVQQLEAQVEQIEERLQQARDQLKEAERERDRIQVERDRVSRQLSDIRSGLSGKLARREHLAQRGIEIRQDLEELQLQLEQGREEIEICRERLHAALEQMEQLAERREEFVQQRDGLRQQLDEIRQQSSRLRNESHQIALRVESMRSSRDSLRQNLERMSGQLRHLEQRRSELRRALEENHQPIEEQKRELELRLEQKLAVEARLTEARAALQETENRLRELEQQRHQSEQQVAERRNGLDQLRMQRQEVLIREKTLDEQLKESGFDREELFREMPEGATLEQWQEQVERMANRIQRLGPINLAAIDEFREQSERMSYIEAQHADVTQSLETLENAIRKIDRETRTRFRETFDRVNSGLQQRFPQLFGGGHAYLQLTGEDLLDTGVTVMARPPGKRNSSIHLLSGGEKALTAVALVFAIFELNPAPFCMLDEVDAPLDDANVERFCAMVKQMSEQVQFIFITHNKITMEMANQLTGVTMHEPGVSRLVSVDVEEAVKLAAV